MKLKYFPAKPPISPLLLRFLVTRSGGSGFTLLELLIAMVIGSIIVSTLLYGVVNILQTDQRDASRSDTQRDMQMAIDYITRDVREATYVYGITQDTTTNSDGTTSLGPKESCLYDYGAGSLARGISGKCTGLLNYLPAFLKAADNRPVLAFWKAEPLPSLIQNSCRTSAGNVGKVSTDTGYSANLNATPCVAQRMYTLVVYSLNTNNAAPNAIWRGKARIMRYQLPHFTEVAGIGEINDGWVAPIAKDKRPRTWPIGNGNDTSGVLTPNINLQPKAPLPTGNQVLTDFVDNQAVTTYVPGYCPNGFDAPNGFTDSGVNAAFNPAFYVCVRSGALTAAAGSSSSASLATEAAEAAGQGINPEVHIVLKGNAAGRGGIPLLTGEVPFQMETRVLSRGAFGKLSNNN